MFTKRTNILLDQSLWQQLARLAQVKKTSIGELIRKAIEQTYFNNDKRESMKAAYEEILRIRKVGKNIDYKELINHGRKY